MDIPKIITRKNKQYIFIKQCNNNMFLYEDMYTKVKETFTKFDLNLIDNKKFDKVLKIKEVNVRKIRVYDKLLDTEVEYDTIKEFANSIGMNYSTVLTKIDNHSWIKDRWFAEEVN